MRVLLMNQFFWPDSAATSQLLTDLARELSSQGHEVEVICGGTHAATDTSDMPPVTIHRVRGLRFTRGRVGRVLSYLTFYLGAAWRALFKRRPDVVVTLTTPPLLSLIGAVVRRLRRVRFLIWEMDMYPDVAVALGYIRHKGLVHRLSAACADWSRAQADGIIALGECMRARLLERGVTPSKIVVVHNWADSGQITVRASPISESRMDIVYSGNLGLAHDVDTIAAAMLALRDDRRFSFTFVGGGSRRGELARFVEANQLQTVAMRPYVPRADLSETLGLGDIGLVTQRDDCCGSVVPSKVYGLMAAGRPVLFIGPAAATPAQLVNDHACGWHIACGDTDSLVRLLLHLADHREELYVAGRNARHALEANYDRVLGTGRIIAVLTGEPGRLYESAVPVQRISNPVTSVQS